MVSPIPASHHALMRILRARPILWIGAGLSIAADYPSTDTLARKLCQSADDDLDPAQEFTAFIDAFVASVGQGALHNLISEEYDSQVRAPTPLHHLLARLAGRGVFAAIVTSNHDPLIEDALRRERVPHVVQTLEQNASVGPDALRVIKVHGSHTDWATAILSGASRAAFDQHYSFVLKQLDVMLQRRPLVFVGCSMRDPRILDWLDALPPERAATLERWRPMMTRASWDRAVAAHGDALALGNIRPLIIDDHDEHLLGLWRAAADELAPEGTPGPDERTEPEPSETVRNDDRASRMALLALPIIAACLLTLAMWRLWPDGEPPPAQSSAHADASSASMPTDAGAQPVGPDTQPEVPSMPDAGTRRGQPGDESAPDGSKRPTRAADAAPRPAAVDAAPPDAAKPDAAPPPRLWTVTRIDDSQPPAVLLILDGPPIDAGFLRLKRTGDGRSLPSKPRCRIDSAVGKPRCMLSNPGNHQVVVGDLFEVLPL